MGCTVASKNFSPRRSQERNAAVEHQTTATKDNFTCQTITLASRKLGTLSAHVASSANKTLLQGQTHSSPLNLVTFLSISTRVASQLFQKSWRFRIRPIFR